MLLYTALRSRNIATRSCRRPSCGDGDNARSVKLQTGRSKAVSRYTVCECACVQACVDASILARVCICTCIIACMCVHMHENDGVCMCACAHVSACECTKMRLCHRTCLFSIARAVVLLACAAGHTCEHACPCITLLLWHCCQHVHDLTVPCTDCCTHTTCLAHHTIHTCVHIHVSTGDTASCRKLGSSVGSDSILDRR